MRKTKLDSRFVVKTTNSNTRVHVGASPADHIKSSAKSTNGIVAKNSNTKVLASGSSATSSNTLIRSPGNRGLNSEGLRDLMISRLQSQGITDRLVLSAMRQVPRHLFVEEALASRAYEDSSLPIGFGQTISQPWIVAHMISLACQQKNLGNVLEIGTGCGYQAAVLSLVAKKVFSIERIAGLFELAKKNLNQVGIDKLTLILGDGMLGLPQQAPFDAIIIAAAGLKIPQNLYSQLAIGGRLLAPEGDVSQRLIMIERKSLAQWERYELDDVRFVPLKSGIVF